jgi:sodium/proline symporter/sodium/pantothenate symporter
MMVPETSGVLGWIVVYILLTMAIGGWAARRTKTQQDFFLAGQRLGLLVTGVTTMSAAFSGVVFLGGPGLMSIGVTAGLLCWLVGKRLRLLAEVPGVLTVPDAVRLRYRSRAAGGAAAIAVLSGSVGYLAAQLLALGIVLQSIFPVDLLVGIGVGLLIVGSYSAAGGMVAGVWTDLAQGVIMLVAAVGVWSATMASGGGLASIVETVAASESFGWRFLDPLGNQSAVAAASLFLVFSIGTLGQPQMLHKFMMIRDVGLLRWLPLVLAGSQAVCLLVWLGLGLAVPALVATGGLPPLEQPDQAAPLFLLHQAPSALAGLALAGVLAAIMSTADSFLNIAAGALVRDLPRAFGWRPAEGLGRLRLAVVAVALAAGLLAASYGDLIALLGTFAFGTFAAALAPALAIGLNWGRVTGAAATASISTGIVTAVGLELLARQGHGLPAWIPLPASTLPSVVALLASLGVLFTVSFLTRAERRSDPLIAVLLSA